MKIYEALDYPEPQDRSNRKIQKNYKPMSKLKFLTVYISFTILVVICLYSIAQFNKKENYLYKDTFKVTNTNTNTSSAVLGENDYLNSENIILREQLKSLKEEYDRINKKLQDIKKQNDQINNKNKELTQDNIELQNSLKDAASVGIKPQNFTRFDGLSSRGDLNRGSYIGKFLGTAYTPSALECGNSKGITNSGEPVIPGVSLAVDGRYWPFGTVFYIKGLGYAVAMDSGSAIKGKNRFDFAVFDKKFARKLGSKYWEVYLIKKGNGKIEDLDFLNE